MQWLWDNRELVFGLTLDHARLSVIPIVVGFIVSIPLGWLAARFAIARSLLLSFGGILFTIPSLALFVTLPAITGWRILDEKNVIVVLLIYAVAVMVRGASDAFASVPGDVINSSTAVGFAPWSRFWSVELPLAGPVLLASIRVVSVSTVSLLSVGSVIGVRNLGRLFIDGYQRSFPTEILIGVIAIIVLAIIFDVIIVQVGRLLMPWTHALKQPKKARFTLTPSWKAFEGRAL